MQQTSSIQIDDSFVVNEILGDNRHVHALGNQLSEEGIMLDTPGKLLGKQRFMWLEFGLPDSGTKIKALGEVTERSKLGIKVRFKHMFPDQKRELREFLNTRISMN